MTKILIRMIKQMKLQRKLQMTPRMLVRILQLLTMTIRTLKMRQKTATTTKNPILLTNSIKMRKPMIQEMKNPATKAKPTIKIAAHQAMTVTILREAASPEWLRLRK